MAKDSSKDRTWFVGPLLLFGGLGVILCFISYYLNPIGIYISIIGSVASLLGIWLAFKQIMSVKEITTKTNNAINVRLKKINGYLTLADVSRIMTTTKEILGYLSSSKLELSILRMRDLKAELVQLRQNTQILDSLLDLDAMNKCITNLGIDIENINKRVLNNRSISMEAVTNNMDFLLTVLSEIEGKLKYKEYDETN